MKLKDLRSKDLGELKKILEADIKTIRKASLEHRMRQDKNVKKLANLKREVATLYGMISAQTPKETR